MSAPVLPPTTTMTPTTVVQRRPSILVPTASLAHGHVRRPSVYARVTPSAPSESPSVASASDRSLRHVGEGALDDSDSSDGGASESAASEVEPYVELAPAPPPRRTGVSKARSMSVGRGVAHPSPLSRLAGQQQWTEEEDEGEGGARLGSGSVVRPALGMRRRHVEDDEASPSPGSTDTDGERSDNSEGEDRDRIVATKARSVTRTRSRKNSSANVRRFKNRSRSSTVASLAAPLLSPARSSRSVPPPMGSPKHPPSRAVMQRAGSPSSVETVIAASIRDQENEVVTEDPGKHVTVAKEPACWAEMSHRRKVAVVEEEGQLREVGWRALREALEEYADQVCGPFLLGRVWR